MRAKLPSTAKLKQAMWDELTQFTQAIHLRRDYASQVVLLERYGIFRRRAKARMRD